MRRAIRGTIPAKSQGIPPRRLTTGAFLASSDEGLDNLIAAARWEFIKPSREWSRRALTSFGK